MHEPTSPIDPAATPASGAEAAAPPDKFSLDLDERRVIGVLIEKSLTTSVKAWIMGRESRKHG